MNISVKDMSIKDIDLSVRSTNCLARNGIETVGDMLRLTEEDLFHIRNLGKKSVDEILDKIEELAPHADDSIEVLKPQLTGPIYDPDNREIVLDYVKRNDISIQDSTLSNRSRNQLVKNHYDNLSDIIFFTEQDLNKIPALGSGSVTEIVGFCRDYLDEHRSRIEAFCSGDLTAIADDESLKESILGLFKDLEFKGLSFREIYDGLDLPDGITEERIKSLIGELISENELEYVDFRCYRVYGKFADYLNTCPKVTDRNRSLLEKRLEGITLEAIGQDENLTREGVRQIVAKNVGYVISYYLSETGLKFFDEDYYKYFYSTYTFDKKDAEKWLGVDPMIWNYLEMAGVKHGDKPLEDALDDQEGLDHGFRLKIKNYLNRNRLYLDKEWVDHKRNAVENHILKRLCRDEVSFEDFIKIYNGHLEEQGVPFDPGIYITDDVKATRHNRLSDSRCVLWKQNERLRYYDIDGRDYAELFDTLNIAAFENIEFSTLKFIEDYPDIMEKYDIRDQYELHNLMRKTIKEGDFHDFHCGKMPVVRFGSFDRDLAILKILIDHAPISSEDLCNLIHDEYGHDRATIYGSYLTNISEYFHNGVYSIDHKTLPRDRMLKLEENLPDNFYYLDEVREVYSGLYEDAAPEDINPYVLKKMGFSVFSNYVMKGYDSLDSYFTELLTCKDVIDITPLRRRYTYVVTFTAKIMELKRDLRMIEFEPNKLISIKRLEEAGVTKEVIQNYCNKVYDFVEDGKFFTIKSIRNDGFEDLHELEDLGFSDWFYGNLLLSDDRFSFSNFYGTFVFIKGKQDITSKAFIYDIIKDKEVIDRYDLLSELQDQYGCHVQDFLDVYYKVQDTGIYFDRILDRIYLNEELYYQEIDEMEGL